MLIDIIKDALFDSIKLLPFLFAAYLFIEYIERRHSKTMEHFLAGGGKVGFLSGAALGLIPQCGFSAMAADLYSSRVITLGTLVAVFLATSDEAVPIMVADPSLIPTLGKLLLGKFLIAALIGFLIDRILSRHFEKEQGYTGHIEEVDCHTEHEESESLLRAAIMHTLQIFWFILLFNLVINLAIELLSTDRLTAFLHRPGLVQIFCSGLVGMIPNCASSVLLTQLYASGELAFSSLFAGLCTGAGIGPIVLLRTCKSKKQALKVLLLTYLTGIGSGIIMLLFGA